MQFTAEMIAGFLGGEIVGDPKATVNTLAKIEEGAPGALSFLSNPKYEHYIYDTKSSIVIVNKSFQPTAPVPATMVKVEDAYGSFAKLLVLYEQSKPKKTGISPQSAIDASAKLGEGCYVGEFTVICPGAVLGDNCAIYPQCYIGDGVKLGNNVKLMPGVKIYEGCVIGNNVIIHSSSVVGSDGFGFAPNAQGGYDKIPQIGNVVIEDDVEIGSNTSVDRATMGSTFIRKGVKLDNLVQVAHNVVIGENTVIAAQSGIAGSSKVGHNCVLAGQVGLVGHITVGNNVTFGSKTGVSHNIGDNETQLGFFAMPGMSFHRSYAVFRNLPDMKARLDKLERELKK